jgi:hypothetical protein
VLNVTVPMVRGSSLRTQTGRRSIASKSVTCEALLGTMVARYVDRCLPSLSRPFSSFVKKGYTRELLEAV